MISPLTDQETFGRRLRQARERAGFTLRALSDHLGGAIAFPTLSNYEAGRFLPDEANLSLVCRALSVTPETLFRPFRVALSELHFRKKTSFGAAGRKALEAKAEEFFELYYEIEELTGSQTQFVRPAIAPSSVTTTDDAEAYANALRKAWRLGENSLPVITELLEEKGIKIFETRVDEKGFDGLQADAGTDPVIVLNCGANGRGLSVPRRRLTAVHELGHVVLPLPREIDENEKLNEPLTWRFAGALMMPRDMFESAFGTNRTKISVEELVQLKLRFRASIWAVMKRAQELQLISPASYKRFCIYANSNGWRTVAEPGDELFPEIAPNGRFCALVRRAASEGLISDARRDALLAFGGEKAALQKDKIF